MAKKKFISPFVLMEEIPASPAPTTEPATFSGQAGVPVGDDETLNVVVQPQVYGQWMGNVAADVDGNGSTDYEDYSKWMTKNGFAAQISPKSNPES